MEIKGFIPNTMLDWEGMLASTLFLPGCNFRCPFCQNPDLVLNPGKLESVPFGLVEEYLRDRQGWVEGVCITGGEPCIHGDLPELCRKLKIMGVGVKLDTNGGFPEMIERLIGERLVDYVAMDVKAPLEPGSYRVTAGSDQVDIVEMVRRSIKALRDSGVEREFRTTVVPLMHSPVDIGRIAEALRGEKYALQYFSPKVTLDPRYAELRPLREEDMDAMLEEARRHIPDTRVRGAPAGMSQ